MKNKLSSEKGFTLIEVMITMVVLSIGFLGVISMLTGSIGSNSKADTTTSTATIAADHIEFLMTLDYTNALLTDTDGTGTVSLRNPLPPLPVIESVDSVDLVNFVPDQQILNVVSPTQDMVHSIYWNIADNFPTNNTKTVNVIVVTSKRGIQKLVMFTCIIPQII